MRLPMPELGAPDWKVVFLMSLTGMVSSRLKTSTVSASLAFDFLCFFSFFSFLSFLSLLECFECRSLLILVYSDVTLDDFSF
jgi:hypothetical protein